MITMPARVVVVAREALVLASLRLALAILALVSRELRLDEVERRTILARIERVVSGKGEAATL